MTSLLHKARFQDTFLFVRLEMMKQQNRTKRKDALRAGYVLLNGACTEKKGAKAPS